MTLDEVEKIGIERTRTAIAMADLAIIVTDARDLETCSGSARGGAAGGVGAHRRAEQDRPRSGSAEKSDRQRRANDLALGKTGAGIDLLGDAILDVAGAHEDMEGTFLARERHLQALGAAGEHPRCGCGHPRAAMPPLELFAEELREAQHALSEITGEFTADDLLGRNLQPVLTIGK